MRTRHALCALRSAPARYRLGCESSSGCLEYSTHYACSRGRLWGNRSTVADPRLHGRCRSGLPVPTETGQPVIHALFEGLVVELLARAGTEITRSSSAGHPPKSIARLLATHGPRGLLFPGESPGLTAQYLPEKHLPDTELHNELPVLAALGQLLPQVLEFP